MLHQIDLEWTEGVYIEKIALHNAQIWAAKVLTYSPEEFLFPDANPDDLVLPANQIDGWILNFTFYTDDFDVDHVKVWFTNSCYAQFYTAP